MMRIGFILVFLLPPMIISGQSSFGIQMDIGNSILTNISDDTIVPYGFSGSEHHERSKFFVSPSLRYRKTLNSKYSIEVGVGYLLLTHQSDLKYYYSFFQYYLDSTLEMKLHYISLPISFNYSVPIALKSSLLLAATLSTNVLISHEDNYLDIIQEEIYWIKRDWYAPVVFNTGLSMAYQMKVESFEVLEIGMFLSRDVSPFVKKQDAWGFYNNLLPARNIRYGLQLKYLFKL